jgi:hypothetical protein
MKKLLILSLIFVTILVLAACSSKEPAKTSTSGAEAYPFVSGGSLATTTSKAPVTTAAPITTLPEIDMDALYKKVFEDTSVYLGGSELFMDDKSLPELDYENKEAIFYIGKGGINPNLDIMYNKYSVWKVKGITSEIFGSTDNCKYSIRIVSQAPYAKYVQILDYYHTKYLDVLLDNLTYDTANSLPVKDELIEVLRISDGNYTYRVYEDMSLYRESGKKGDPLMKSDISVDMPYIYAMYVANEIYQMKRTSDLAPRYVMNADRGNEKPITEINTINDRGEKSSTYYILDDGRVYSDIGTVAEFSEYGMDKWGFFLRADIRAYYDDAIKNGILMDIIYPHNK